jgi:hypothetical protein
MNMPEGVPDSDDVSRPTIEITARDLNEVTHRENCNGLFSVAVLDAIRANGRYMTY